MSNRYTTTLSFIGAAILVALMLWAGLVSGAREEIQALVEQFGYGGMFFGAAVSGFNLLVPFPFIALLPVFLSAGFSFWVSVIVIALGMTAGDLIGYLLGHTGRKAIPEEKIPEKITASVAWLKDKSPLLPYLLLFLYVSAAPAPNEAVVVPMAFLGYALKKMAPILLFGNVVFNTVAGLVVTGVVSFAL